MPSFDQRSSCPPQVVMGHSHIQSLPLPFDVGCLDEDDVTDLNVTNNLTTYPTLHLLHSEQHNYTRFKRFSRKLLDEDMYYDKDGQVQF